LGTLNVAFTDVPAGDDYFLLFLNSTHGLMYGNSPKFSIVASSSNASSHAVSGKPTVTISGAPNPTAAFVTTFPPTNGGFASWEALSGLTASVIGLVGVLSAGFLGGAWAVL